MAPAPWGAGGPRRPRPARRGRSRGGAPASRPPGEFLRGGEAEFHIIVVRPGKGLWQAHLPDYDVELETEALSVDELREVAGRAFVLIG